MCFKCVARPLISCFGGKPCHTMNRLTSCFCVFRTSLSETCKAVSGTSVSCSLSMFADWAVCVAYYCRRHFQFCCTGVSKVDSSPPAVHRLVCCFSNISSYCWHNVLISLFNLSSLGPLVFTLLWRAEYYFALNEIYSVSAPQKARYYIASSSCCDGRSWFSLHHVKALAQTLNWFLPFARPQYAFDLSSTSTICQAHFALTWGQCHLVKAVHSASFDHSISFLLLWTFGCLLDVMSYASFICCCNFWANCRWELHLSILLIPKSQIKWQMGISIQKKKKGEYPAALLTGQL